MRKRLRFRAELVENFSKVNLTLIEQSHFEEKFGSYSSWWNSSGHIQFASLGETSFLQAIATPYNFVLILPINKDAVPTNSVIISLELYKEIKAAIIEYNNYDFANL